MGLSTNRVIDMPCFFESRIDNCKIEKGKIGRIFFRMISFKMSCRFFIILYKKNKDLKNDGVKLQCGIFTALEK